MKKKEDPIKLLKKEFSGTERKAVIEKNRIVFENNIKLKLDTITGWRPPQQNKIYSLGDLYLFLKVKKEGKSNSEYLELLKMYKNKFEVQLINREHMKDITEYFFGEVEQTNCIDESLIEKSHQKSQQMLEKRNYSNFNYSKASDLINEIFEVEMKVSEEKYNKFRKFRRIKLLEERTRKMRSSKDFRCIIKIIKQISSSQKKNKSLKEKSNKRKIGDGLNKITRILNMKSEGMNHGRPIIIIPNELLKGNLNMHNALEFFTKKTYMNVRMGEGRDSKNEKWISQIQKKKMCEIFSHVIANTSVGFEIWDDLRLVKQRKRIESVVAIFIKGTQFEFKNIERIFGFKDVATLFNKIKGFYLYYSGHKINPAVNKWNVTKLELHPEARHKDTLLLRSFWNKVDRFLLNE